MLRPTCFARTRTGYMPGIVRGRDAAGMVVVQTLDGKRRYSFSDSDVWSLEEGWRRIRQARIDLVMGKYHFEVLLEKPLTVRCQNPEHPRRSNYILAKGRRGWTCTCPAYTMTGGPCKHIDAFLELERLDTPEPRLDARSREPQLELPLAA